MPKREDNLHNRLQDALLTISETDVGESCRLLAEAGMNPDRLIEESLGKIAKYRTDLEKRSVVEKQLLITVKDKINRLLSEAPAQTNAFLTGYFRQHSLPPVRFGATGKLDSKTLSQAKGKLDLNDLSERLDDESNREKANN